MTNPQMVSAANGLIKAFREWRTSSVMLSASARKLRSAIDRWEDAYAIELDAKATAKSALTAASKRVKKTRKSPKTA
jgi:hypothetical protein